jgi:hypothetical protein
MTSRSYIPATIVPLVLLWALQVACSNSCSLISLSFMVCVRVLSNLALTTVTELRLGIEHVSTLSSPFLLAHWFVADDVLAE